MRLRRIPPLIVEPRRLCFAHSASLCCFPVPSQCCCPARTHRVGKAGRNALPLNNQLQAAAHTIDTCSCRDSAPLPCNHTTDTPSLHRDTLCAAPPWAQVKQPLLCPLVRNWAVQCLGVCARVAATHACRCLFVRGLVRCTLCSLFCSACVVYPTIQSFLELYMVKYQDMVKSQGSVQE